jgi:hypothetical protein
MPKHRKDFPNRGRVTLDLPYSTHQRLNALIERRPTSTRTSIISGLIHAAYERLELRERKAIEQEWMRERAEANDPNDPLRGDTFVIPQHDRPVATPPLRPYDPATFDREMEDVLSGFSDEEDDEPVYPAHGDDR